LECCDLDKIIVDARGGLSKSFLVDLLYLNCGFFVFLELKRFDFWDWFLNSCGFSRFPFCFFGFCRFFFCCEAMEFREIEECGTVRRRWEDMDIDILVKIFQSLTVFELTSGIAHVCSSWRLAACDPFLWRTLDLSMLKSNFIKIPLEPYVYVHGHSDKTLTRFLKISLSLSRGNITSLFFHFNLYVSEDHLTYTAQR
jgi:hypothetical protein